MDYTRLKLLLLGTDDVLLFSMAVFFACIGMAIILLIKSKKRDKHSANTPFKFNGWFLFLDNLKEVILGFLLVIMALRFSVECSGVKLTVWYAFGIGISFQKLSSWISIIESKARK